MMIYHTHHTQVGPTRSNVQGSLNIEVASKVPLKHHTRQKYKDEAEVEGIIIE